MSLTYTRCACYVLSFYLYSNLQALYPILPPLISFFFILYKTREDERLQDRYILCIFTCLLFLEAINQEPLGFLILLFILYEKLVLQFVLRTFEERILWDAFHMLAIYVLYTLLLSALHATPLASWDRLLIYTALEFILWRVYGRR
ncbi:hypothetical protein [Helicobacter ailurogastricus]|uniref:Uncharacterized protein n=1 Tax=Helicobacter ailurogastricus TaxID=1578720 RepID=A0A0K2XF80_9HELI|nr:hypothetical protein [Helicobacter ailurogastricus]CRF41070.1 hypothetical protein HAL011_08500 [Helicobacter ailurogastricus]CRF42184.1 hypothetical protein HAL013_03450 [Helicobacter ailurogastricus]CRF44253.1 hypothetical protein HAL09_08280 [Helicobacter ailurogastricus]BDQ28282.1 hypothetical protein ASB7_01190 [Helicobacter ailurogastricus]GLH57966.1 hypothetical protein NHP214376_07540 [Helicobacter ailurogastricus]